MECLFLTNAIYNDCYDSCGTYNLTDTKMNNKVNDFKVQKIISNNKKMDEMILKLEFDVEQSKIKRDALKEEVDKLKEKVVNTKKEIAICNQIESILERQFKKKFLDNLKTEIEIGQLLWKNIWHKIIAENQTAALKTNYERTNALLNSESYMNHTKENNISHSEDIPDENYNKEGQYKFDEEIQYLINKNNKLKQQIQMLKQNLPFPSDFRKIQNEISYLEDRNDRMLRRMKGQLALLQRHNSQKEAELKILKEQAQQLKLYK